MSVRLGKATEEYLLVGLDFLLRNHRGRRDGGGKLDDSLRSLLASLDVLVRNALRGGLEGATTSPAPEKAEEAAPGPRKFGPMAAAHPSVGERCPACGVPFAAGDYTAVVPLGPGDDAEEQRKAREGRPYNAVGVQLHWACATGEAP